MRISAWSSDVCSSDLHGDVVSRFNGPALYVSAMKGRVGGRRWHILVPHVRVLSSVNQKVAAHGFGSRHPDPADQTQPRAASETGAPSPNTKWSSRSTSTPHNTARQRRRERECQYM